MNAADPVLESVLESVLARGELCPVVVVGRRRHQYASTYPADVVTYRCEDGSIGSMHVKYGENRVHDTAHGHRGPLEEEARAYRELVAPTGLSAPRLYGTHLDDRGSAWLLIEHLEGAVELDEAPDPEGALVLTATWIGTFQRWHDDAATTTSSLRYDRQYYRGWLDRTVAYAGPWSARLPWLCELANACEPLLAELSDAPPSVIHGELTPSNVLFRAGQVYPVDWQSTAVALGEIDVVALLDKWPIAIADRGATAYIAARYERPAPGQSRRLDLARLYWDLRWLGDRPEWTALDKVGPRFEHLHAVVGRLNGWRS